MQNEPILEQMKLNQHQNLCQIDEQQGNLYQSQFSNVSSFVIDLIHDIINQSCEKVEVRRQQKLIQYGLETVTNIVQALVTSFILKVQQNKEEHIPIEPSKPNVNINVKFSQNNEQDKVQILKIQSTTPKVKSRYSIKNPQLSHSQGLIKLDLDQNIQQITRQNKMRLHLKSRRPYQKSSSLAKQQKSKLINNISLDKITFDFEGKLINVNKNLNKKQIIKTKSKSIVLNKTKLVPVGPIIEKLQIKRKNSITQNQLKPIEKNYSVLPPSFLTQKEVSISNTNHRKRKPNKFIHHLTQQSSQFQLQFNTDTEPSKQFSIRKLSKSPSKHNNSFSNQTSTQLISLKKSFNFNAVPSNSYLQPYYDYNYDGYQLRQINTAITQRLKLQKQKQQLFSQISKQLIFEPLKQQQTLQHDY